MKSKWDRVGNLDCIVKPGKPEGPCVVLFHGYGADANDLYPLHAYLNQSEDVNWIFPQGPIQIMLGPGLTGRAWFDIDIQELERAMAQGSYRAMADLRPKGVDEAYERANSLYEVCLDSFSKVIVGGFSQGAMLSTELVFRSSVKPEALVVLSGTLLDKENWKNLAKSCRGLNFFMSHGSNDALLDPKQARALLQLFKEAGMIGNLNEFRGGHEIPMPTLDLLGNFLRQRI